MKFTPHAYQEKAVNFLCDNPSAGLFMDMGLGKTSSVLTAFDELKYNYFEVGAMLVVAPLRVALLTWQQEAAKWDHLQHLRVVVIHGKPEQRRAAMAQKADVYVINYDGLDWLRSELIANRQFPRPIDMVVFDESTALKNQSSIRSKVCAALAQGTKRHVILTGTPTPNGLIDIWHQVYLLDRGERLGPSISGFRGQYFIHNEITRKYNPRKGVSEWVTNRIGDICLTMKAEDYLDMPEKINNTLETGLPEKLRGEYETLEEDFFLVLEDTTITAMNAASLSMKLRQFVQGFLINTEDKTVHGRHNEKVKTLREVTSGSGSPVLVAIQFRHEVEMLRAEYGYDIPAIYGGTSAKESIQIVEAWNRGEVPILLAHPASIGHGVNLQEGGSTIVWFGLTWNLEHYLQFNARLYRQGQLKSVIVHHLIMKDTIDEVVLEALRKKEGSMAGLIQRLKDWKYGAVQDETEDGERVVH